MKAFFALTIGLCAVLTAAQPTVNQADMFDTLDEYSLLGVLEQLEFGDLATVAITNPRVRQIIHNNIIFPEILSGNATLRIELFVRDANQATAYYIPDYEVMHLRTRTLCTGFEHIRATLKAFCPLFGRILLMITYDHGSPGNRVPEIVDHINRYCSTIPQRVMISDPYGLSDMFTAPNASSLNIYYPDAIENLLIGAHFPQLQELTIRVERFFAIREHLPHLQRFELLDKSCGHFALKAFAEMNPQIRSVKLDLCDGLNGLNEVNELFPNLETLYYRPKKDHDGLRPYGGQGGVQSVRFRNVKSYTIVLMGYHYSDSNQLARYLAGLLAIQFDQLESLTYIAFGTIAFDIQMDFVAQYKQVKSIDYSCHELSYGQVRRLVDLAPNLKEIAFKLGSGTVDHADFKRLMQDTHLESIVVYVPATLVEDFLGLELPAQWILYQNMRVYTIFVAMKFKRIDWPMAMQT